MSGGHRVRFLLVAALLALPGVRWTTSPASAASSGGYLLVASDGGIFNYGDAGFFGSAGGSPLNKPVVGMAASPTGRGYWLVASDGGIFNYGDARFFGSAGGSPLNKPVVGMAASPTGRGYWLVASDGGIFGYGDAGFFGSAGGSPLNRPVVGMAASPTGRGYWLVASDGGIFGYGDAGFFGSAGGTRLNQPVVGMAASPTGKGYWLVASDGGIFGYGDAGFFGSAGGAPLNKPVVGMAASPPPSTTTTPPSPPPPPPEPVLLAAGDIADCTVTGDAATAALLDNLAGTVLPLGDLAYEDGTATEFADCYGPTWGRHKARTRPTPGNHEYRTANAGPYFDYFGAAAGADRTGWYSFDLGGWHIVSLNSEDCVDGDGCPTTSPQVQWLQADLAAHPTTCSLAFWHQPRYSSAVDRPTVAPLWDAFAAAGGDVVLTGHQHMYERLGPLDGVRSFVVGTGGRSHHGLPSGRRAGSEAINADTFGVLRLVLHAGSYDWQFVPEAGKSFTDSGSAACR